MQTNIFGRNIFSEKDLWIALPAAALWSLTLVAALLERSTCLIYFYAVLTLSLIPVVFYWRFALYTIAISGIGLMQSALTAHIRMFPGQWESYLALVFWVIILVNTFRMYNRNKSDRNVRKSTVMKIVSGIALTALAVVMSFVLLASVITFLFGLPFTARSFDQALWLKSARNEKADNPRGYMAADLIRNHLSTSMTRDDVRKLLGRPNTDFTQTKNQDSYYLGMHGAFCLDAQALNIKYRNGKLSDAYVTEY